MGLNRNVSLATGLRYKGQGPMLTFVLHRISGLGMAIFVTIHLLASFMSTQDWAAGGVLNSIYEHWAFQLFIFFCALFHAINGLRITILDLFPHLLSNLRQAVWVEWAVFIPLYAFAVFVILNTALGG
jgi:succinate dehydrogenase / fumarate reductase cytochrome b subunit